MSVERPRFMLAMILRDIRRTGENPDLGPLNKFIDRTLAYVKLREAEPVPEDHIDRIAHQRETLQFQIALDEAVIERYRLTHKAPEGPVLEKVTVVPSHTKRVFDRV